MKTLHQNKNINLLIFKYFLLISIAGILIVEILSIIRMKPFWTDEWWIISNIKFKEIEDYFFRPLDWYVDFPRVYLALLKYFSRIFNYSYLSLVLIPFIIQLLNIIFFWYISTKIIYKEDELKSYLLIFVFLGYQTTFEYFTQVKQYTMEMFCSLIAIWQFHELSDHFNKRHKSSMRFWTAASLLLIAPFFSHTYSIAAVPFILILFFTFIYNIKRYENISKTLLPITLFMIVVILIYNIDIKYTLSSKDLTNYWSEYIVTYKNINSFAQNLLRSFFIFMSLIFIPINRAYKIWNSAHINYLGYLVRILFFLIPIVIGMINISIDTIKGFIDKTKKENSFFKGFIIMSFNEPFSISTYFIILFFAVWLLYFCTLLPLGPKRLNYFCVPMIGYFWLEGISFFTRNKNKLIHIYGNIILIVGLISLLFFIGIGYTKEALVKSGSQALYYQTIGKAIKVAYKTDAAIAIQQKWKYPRGWLFDLMLKTHPYYQFNINLKTLSMDAIKIECRNTIQEDLSFIFIEENDYDIVSLKDFCLSLSERAEEIDLSTQNEGIIHER